MKKTIWMACAALLLAMPVVQAQKVNESSFRSKIEKSDADIADAKKNGKASTWINRGKLFYDVAAEPTKNLFINMDAAMLKLNSAVGDPAAVEPAEVQGQACEAWIYPYFTAYVADGKVLTWKQTRSIVEDAPAQAIAAYNKAFELDPKSAEKVKAGLKQISDFCSLVGNAGLNLGTYADAADAYVMAFDAQSSPAYGTPDPVLLYYAGYLRTVDGPQHPASFVLGAEYLDKALALGYVDEEGAIYYYLFHSLYGQKESDPEAILRAKDALLTGIEKFPKNERILEGLMQLYTSEQGVGDPSDLIALIDNAIAENPENVDLWFGRGRTFYALKNYDESIASFEKIVELQPESFDGYYYLGVFYTIKGDAMNQELNSRQYSSQSAYDTDLKEVNAVYLAAVPYFEKAHQLKPEDADTLEFLKQLCFRLRDEEGIMEKYNIYNDLYKQAKGLE
ncbi:MAG: tetratricopeptide repeat protein [Alistipes sp.]|nr:tetratricopeptide repeat protein [Alistipes senegalensis]MCM1250125.1 tetratricopeptide repeat protein [Alistipes sp.]